MEETQIKGPSDAIVISKKVIFSFISGIFFTILLGLVVWKISRPIQQVQDIVDQQNVIEDKKSPTKSPKKTDIKNTTFIHEYPNYGKYKGLPAGGWLNLKNNMQPNIRGNVGIIAFFVHYQGFTQKAFPILQDIYIQERDKDTIVVGINSNYSDGGKSTDTAQVQQTLTDHHVTFPVVIDANNTGSNYADTFTNSAYPSILIVDKFGNVRYVHPGAGIYDELYTAIKDIQEEDTESPPSVDTLISEHKDALIKAAGFEQAFSIEKRGLGRIGTSPIYTVSLGVSKVDMSIGNVRAEDNYKSTFVTIGKTEDGRWLVGIPHDETFCTMMKQANLSDDEAKNFEMIKCGTFE
ncbi:TlpA family protein disulfide reductase [Candidatus Woesebacteria bacterium]|nr:TlpA family protein disulfide reductase [Candidatus Woesebacteria bacterium]